jgi:radical SAM protein with 4Fe4S-binding SPASM domain
VIPRLRDNVKVREESTGVVFFYEGSHYFLSYFEAFVLSLFDGKNSVDDLVSLLGGLKNSPREEKIKSNILKIIKNYKNILELQHYPLRRLRFIDSYQYLLKSKIPHNESMRLESPLGIDLYLTRKCNLNCIYCFADAEHICPRGANQEDSKEMDTDLVLHLVDQMADLQVQRVSIAGGEPTLRPDLPKIVKKIVKNDIDLFLATNGYNISIELAQELKNSGLRKVQTKLDTSNSASQDLLSGVNNSRIKLIKGIMNFKKCKIEVSTVSVITSLNISQISQVIKQCVALGIDEYIPRLYAPGIWSLNGRGGSYLNPSLESIDNLNREIQELKKMYEGVMKIAPLNLSTFHKREERRIHRCPGLMSAFSILDNGLVVPCEMLADFSEKFIIGNARNEALIDIWNSKKANQWISREEFLSRSICLDCEEFRRCLGGCPWKSIVSYGEWICDPHCTRSPQIPIPFINF